MRRAPPSVACRGSRRAARLRRVGGAMKPRDLRVEGYRPLIPPAILLDELPLSETGSRTVASAREELVRILDRDDDRLIVVVGPCSVHDVEAAIDYARRLATVAADLAADLRLAVRATGHPHRFIGVTEQGLAAFVSTRGKPYGHVILRGGARGPNYDRASVRGALDALREAGLPERLIIDASHGNSERDHMKQVVVAEDIAGQIAAGERGIAGVMIESFLVAGRQELTDPARLVYGQSITDACIGWDETVTALQGLASAARERRSHGAGQRPRVASTKREPKPRPASIRNSV